MYLTEPSPNSSMWDLVLWPGIEPGPSVSEAQSLSHWTTQEVPNSVS